MGIKRDRGERRWETQPVVDTGDTRDKIRDSGDAHAEKSAVQSSVRSWRGTWESGSASGPPMIAATVNYRKDPADRST